MRSPLPTLTTPYAPLNASLAAKESDTMLEVIESRRLVRDDGKTASLYGASPWYDSEDRKRWRIEIRGYTWRNVKTGSIGLGRAPVKTREEAQAIADAINSR